MTHKTMSVLSVSALLALCGSVFASPGLDVRSVPVGPIFQLPGFPSAGPQNDPSTQAGQWFGINAPERAVDSRSHEFHDNTPDHLAVQGRFGGYTFNGNQVTGYQLVVSITNNTSQTSGPFRSLPNSHGEDRLPTEPYRGPMYGVRFSAHWADDGTPGNFRQGGAHLPSRQPGPSTTSPGTSNTFAVGYDTLAWYSFTSEDAVRPRGAFQVPSWDFGDIEKGQTATRILSFSFYSPLNLADVPAPSTFQPTPQDPDQDLLIARSTDIRIGSYFQDDPIINRIRDGAASPFPNGESNSSVFFNIPTPGSAAMLVLGGMLAARRRR